MKITDKQRIDFLATADGGFPAACRIGDQDIYGPMTDRNAEPYSPEMVAAFRETIDRAMADAKKGKRKS